MSHQQHQEVPEEVQIHRSGSKLFGHDPSVEEAVKTLSHYNKMKSHFHQARNCFTRSGRVIVAGAGFLADAYDLFVINIALLMMKQNNYGVVQTPDIKKNVSMIAICGALTGQVLFGLLGDQFGRKWTFISTASLTILGTVLQACATANNPSFNIYQQLMLFRFLMGVGVGGEYPMASTVTSEGSKPKDRGRNLAAVFSMQGVGRVLCATVLVLCAHFISDPNLQWRVAILMGAVPMMSCIAFRWMPESEAYEECKAAQVPANERIKLILATMWANRWKLAGTAGSWFILDVVFYGNSLFSADVTAAMGGKHTVKTESMSNLYIQLMAMPGYILGILLIDVMGRKPMQLFGFAGELIIFSVMAAFLEQLKGMKTLFIFLYAMTFFFDDCGPNLTTFVIPSEIYPTEVRSTCHGISAAFGKAGAAIGAHVFSRVTQHWCPNHFCTKKTPAKYVDKGMRAVFIVCACLAALGLAWTWFLVDDTPHESLEMLDSLYADEEDLEAMKGIVMKAIQDGNLRPELKEASLREVQALTAANETKDASH